MANQECAPLGIQQHRKASWLESKFMYLTFSCSAWISVLAAIGWLFCFFTLQPGEQYSGPIRFFPLVVVAITAICLLGIGLLTITLGMVIDSIWRGPSVWAKIGCFFLIFFTGPFGATLYFFSVYRRRVLALREGMNG